MLDELNGNENFLDMFISFNDTKTLAYLNIRPNSKINRAKLQEALQEAFKKVKLSLNTSDISFGIIEDREIINHLKNYILMDEEERKKDIYSFTLAKGKPPVNGEDSEFTEYINMDLKKSGKVDEKTGKVDHKDLGFSDRIVPENTKLFTLTKPTQGNPGIAVTGEIIEPVPGELKHKIKYDKRTIYEKENDKEINYYAAKSGFLYKDDSKGYFVDEKVLVKSIDYNVGNIDGEDVEESSVEVHGSTSITESAIKPGFKVEAKKINITGNIGSEAIVHGENIDVNGIADKDSIVTGKNIKIKKIFNNTVSGENIIIDELNGSTVTGEKIFVKNSLSGTINGSEVLILNESRGTTFTIDKFMFIKNLRGSSKQTITLSPFVLEKDMENYETLKKEFEKNNLTLQEVKKETELSEKNKDQMEISIENILENYITFDPNKKRAQMDMVKNIISNDQWNILEKKFNIEFALHDIQKFELYRKNAQTLNEKKDEIKLLKNKIDQLATMITNIETSVKRVQIIINNFEKDVPLILLFDKKEFKLNIDVQGIVHITFPNFTPIIKSFDKKSITSLEQLISPETMKLLKTLIR